jgi:hypothetical protein
MDCSSRLSTSITVQYSVTYWMWYLRSRVVVAYTACRSHNSVPICKHATSVGVIMDVVEGQGAAVLEVVEYHMSEYLLSTCAVNRGQRQHGCS